jgi:uncharacterized protein (DUF1778 family)
MATNSRTQLRRTERLEARVTPEEKELFVRVAEATGQSLTDFMLNQLRRAAQEVQLEFRVMMLSAADSHRFAESLMAPPAPNDTLLQAAKRYREVGKPLVSA